MHLKDIHDRMFRMQRTSRCIGQDCFSKGNAFISSCQLQRASNTIANSHAIDWKDDCEEEYSAKQSVCHHFDIYWSFVNWHFKFQSLVAKVGNPADSISPIILRVGNGGNSGETRERLELILVEGNNNSVLSGNTNKTAVHLREIFDNWWDITL